MSARGRWGRRWVWAAALAVPGLWACEGPAGPPGPAGPAGPAADLGGPVDLGRPVDAARDAALDAAARLDATLDQGTPLDAALDAGRPDATPDASPDASPPDAGVDPACPPWTPPPGLGGPINAAVDVDTAARWLAYRDAREADRLHAAYDPAADRARVRVEQAWIAAGCVSVPQLVDVGRALFLRPWTLEDGFGNDLAGTPGTAAGDRPRPNLRRFQKGHFGGPDAHNCVSCHWKGGFAGAGDRADGSFLYGDGDDVRTHDLRNPPALWGAGWAERIGAEMTADLAEQVAQAQAQAADSGAAATVNLTAKGTFFGTVTAQPDGALDTSGVQGVDPDLVVKPFGWKGIFPTLRAFTQHSLHIHMNLQAEALVAAPGDLDLGGGPDPLDPDADGVTREITEGMLTSLVLFMATLDAPGLSVPEEGPYLADPFARALPEVLSAQDFALRWLDGAAVFEATGCSGCHTPFMPVRDPVYTTTAALSGHTVAVNLATDGAQPTPPFDPDDGQYWVPVFSDFKRHDLGPGLAARHVEAGVPTAQYLTRRLWGLAQTGPYLHDGSATTVDGAIARHGGEAAFAAEAWQALPERDKANLRVFLVALRRAPSLRVR